MAQTTGAMPKSNYKAEVSLNGSSWTDISGNSTTVEVDGGEQQTGEQFTASGSVPIVIGSNKVSAVTAKVNIIYTETAGEAFQVVWGQYIGASKLIYFRYSPKGGATGDKRYVASNDAGSAFACPIVTCLPPDVDAGSGDPAMAEFSIIAPKFLQEAIP
jgi:hypothetical protein